MGTFMLSVLFVVCLGILNNICYLEKKGIFRKFLDVLVVLVLGYIIITNTRYWFNPLILGGILVVSWAALNWFVSGDPKVLRIINGILGVLTSIFAMFFISGWYHNHWIYASLGILLTVLYLGRVAINITRGCPTRFREVGLSVVMIVCLIVGGQIIIDNGMPSVFHSGQKEVSSSKIPSYLYKIFSSTYEKYKDNGFIIYVEKEIITRSDIDPDFLEKRLEDFCRSIGNSPHSSAFDYLYLGGQLTLIKDKPVLITSTGRVSMTRGGVVPSSGQKLHSRKGICFTDPCQITFVRKGDALRIEGDEIDVFIDSDGNVDYADIDFNH